MMSEMFVRTPPPKLPPKGKITFGKKPLARRCDEMRCKDQEGRKQGNRILDTFPSSFVRWEGEKGFFFYFQCKRRRRRFLSPIGFARSRGGSPIGLRRAIRFLGPCPQSGTSRAYGDKRAAAGIRPDCPPNSSKFGLCAWCEKWVAKF